jgi:hypothetical protein
MNRARFIKWAVETAATEFDINPRTLRKRLKQLDIKPGPGGKYTTKQICAAVFGDIDGERLRLVREQADCQAIENAQARRELINVNELVPRVTAFTSAIRERILSNPKLDENEKDKVLLELRGCAECLAPSHRGDVHASAAVSGQ